MSKRSKQIAAPPKTLKGWQQIAALLGEPVSVAQRWASEGMPVQRQGQFVSTSPEELNKWMGKESGKPVHIATENADLWAELKRGLSYVRNEKQSAKNSAPQESQVEIEGTLIMIPYTPQAI